MQHVAAPAAPEASMPDVGELAPSGGGFARVVIGTDVPARLERITHRVVHGRLEEGSYSLSAGEGLLCVETPCTVTLPYGDYELVFRGTHDRERMSNATLSVRRETVVLNHTLGRVHRPAGQTVAYVLAGVGVAIVAAAVAVAEENTKQGRTSQDSTLPTVAATGLGMMVLGGFVGIASPGTTQEGSSTQWSPRGPVAGASVGLRF